MDDLDFLLEDVLENEGFIISEGFIKKSNVEVKDAKPAILKAINYLRTKKKMLPVTKKSMIPELNDYIKEGFKLYTVGGTICAVEMTDGKSVGTVYAFMVNQKYKNNIEGNVRAIKINYRKFLGAVIDNNM